MRENGIGVWSISHGCNIGPVFARVTVEWYCPPESYGDGIALEAADRLATSVVESATPAMRQIAKSLHAIRARAHEQQGEKR